MSETGTHRLATAMPGAILETVIAYGETTFVVPRERLRAVLAFLRDDPQSGFSHLSDLTAVDQLNLGREPRFVVVYHLYSPTSREWVRVKAPVGEDDPVVPSIVELWPGANWFEREVWDMFGISFEGHPNLERILMPDDWIGHPLRKDQPVIKEEIEFSHNVERLQRGLRENV